MNRLLLVGLGSNIGDREKQIREAVFQIETSDIKLLALSPVYESEPWGVDHQTSYLNAVAAFSTRLEAIQILQHLQFVEKQLGRNSKSDLKPRTIDLDILGLGNLVLESPEFQIPHPRMADRKFVLQPLVDVCPDWVHPISVKGPNEMLKNCRDGGWIRSWNR